MIVTQAPQCLFVQRQVVSHVDCPLQVALILCRPIAIVLVFYLEKDDVSAVRSKEWSYFLNDVLENTLHLSLPHFVVATKALNGLACSEPQWQPSVVVLTTYVWSNA